MTKVIKAERLIDGLGNPVLENATIVVKGEYIIDVVGQDIDIPSNSDEVYHFPQATILPGLINAHTHLAFNPDYLSISNFISSTPEKGLADLAERQIGEFLQAGVTTVRDLGAPGRVTLELRDKIEAGQVIGARILAAGPVVTTVKGHCYYCGVEVRDKTELASAILNLITAGVDVVKVMATGGGVTPGSNPLQPQFDVVALRRIVEIAHSSGRKVAAHAHSREGIENCIVAGVDTIEHATFLSDQGIEPDYKLIGRLAESEIIVVPTLSPYYVLRNSDDISLGFPQLSLSPRVLYKQVLKLLSTMREAGVKLITGSDSGTWGLTPDNFYQEMEAFIEAGFSPLATIAAATSQAAQALGIDRQTGSIQPGKIADMIVVAGDPITDFISMATPIFVMKMGKIVNKSV